MHQKYNPKKIEPIVQKYWKKNKIFSVSAKSKKKKYFCVPMLPYPSGNLHMGHVRNYTISDVIARYQRMLGKNVLQPIGWDAFGLPAEEAAIKNKISPSQWTHLNIKIMKKQLESLGFSYDWKREITTCQPNYYKWEQWFFIKLYEKKLVYKKTSLVNWCPHDKTVLANEQVQHGKCWRCNEIVILKKMPQWFMKITNYAEELLYTLKKLKKWPKKVLQMQKNWIGKSKGVIIKCKIAYSKEVLKIYTTQPETIMDVTFFAISIYHPIIPLICKNNKKINLFLNKYKNINTLQSDKNKKYIGINTHQFIIHPITLQKIPLWITLYVKHDYATGAIMAVPKYDKNDLKFSLFNKLTTKKNQLKQDEDQILNSKKKLNDIFKKLNQKKLLKKHTCYKLKDWSISRQRYWGAPIPVAYNIKGEVIPVPIKNLPIILPENFSLKKNNKKLSPKKTWLSTKINGEKVTRETDTFDTFIESSWYYARYTCPNFQNGMINPLKTKYWLPIDLYIGGIEHAVMHLIYFRFYHKLMRDFGFVSSDEPVKKLICQGMVLSDAFYIYDQNKKKIWVKPSEITIKKLSKNRETEYYLKSNKKKVMYAGKIKMSKSKNNGIDPDIIINKYGADTLRLFLMFTAPIESELEWNDQSIVGMYRFLKKLWNFTYSLNLYNIIIPINIYKNKEHKAILVLLNHTISAVTDDIQRRNSLNTAIAHIIKFFNTITKIINNTNTYKEIIKISLDNLIKMLYPFAPHICFILWKEIYGEKANIDKESWPMTHQIKENIIFFPIIIQINGKKRIILEMLKSTTKQECLNIASKNQKIKKYLKNKKIKKIIYIANKLINFVLT